MLSFAVGVFSFRIVVPRGAEAWSLLLSLVPYLTW